MRRRIRFRKVILWTLALVVAIGAGGVIAAYNYVTGGETLVEVIRREAPRFLPRNKVDLIQARIRPFVGEVIFNAISVGDDGPGGPGSLAYLPYLQINYRPLGNAARSVRAEGCRHPPPDDPPPTSPQRYLELPEPCSPTPGLDPSARIRRRSRSRMGPSS